MTKRSSDVPGYREWSTYREYREAEVTGGGAWSCMTLWKDVEGRLRPLEGLHVSEAGEEAVRATATLYRASWRPGWRLWMLRRANPLQTPHRRGMTLKGGGRHYSGRLLHSQRTSPLYNQGESA